MGPLAIAGAAAGVAQGLFGIFQGAKMLKEAKKINPFYTPYQGSQAAREQMGMAQTRMNARSPMQAARQRGILGSQAGMMANVRSGATDASQLLQMAGAGQAQTDLATEKLAEQDIAFDQQAMANIMQAQNLMVGEDRMKFQDMMNKYQMDLEQKNMLRRSGQQNIVGGLGAIGGAALGAEKLGQTGEASRISNQQLLGPSNASIAQNFIRSRKP